ncbi:unnamed protein product [Arctogadus glacialis]
MSCGWGRTAAATAPPSAPAAASSISPVTAHQMICRLIRSGSVRNAGALTDTQPDTQETDGATLRSTPFSSSRLLKK